MQQHTKTPLPPAHLLLHQVQHRRPPLLEPKRKVGAFDERRIKVFRCRVARQAGSEGRVQGSRVEGGQEMLGTPGWDLRGGWVGLVGGWAGLVQRQVHNRQGRRGVQFRSGVAEACHSKRTHRQGRRAEEVIISAVCDRAREGHVVHCSLAGAFCYMLSRHTAYPPPSHTHTNNHTLPFVPGVK